jgi:tRNA A37 threonylcarbamoyltransferase TsaD
MIEGALVPHRGGIVPEKIRRQHRERCDRLHQAVHGSASRTSPGIDAAAIRAG